MGTMGEPAEAPDRLGDLVHDRFVLATASAALAVSSILFAQFHHFPYYDPLLLRIFRTGTLLSLAGIAFGIGGAWRPTSLRWHAPASGIATRILVHRGQR
jgi:hypothetical protein